MAADPGNLISPAEMLAERRTSFFARLRALAQEEPAVQPSIDIASGPPTSFPRATATGSAPASRRVRQQVELTSATADSVRAFAAARQCSPHTVLGAALLAALRAYTGASQLRIGFQQAGPRLLTIDIDSDDGFDPLVRRLRLAAAAPGVPAGRMPVVLAQDAELGAAPATAPHGDLVIGAPPSVRALVAESDPDRHETTLVSGLLRYADRILREGLAAPLSPLWSLAPLDEDERRRVLVDPNQTSRPHAPATLTTQFAAALSRYPARLAISEDGGGSGLSYRELAQAAGRLANELRARGVRRGDRVAVLVSRGDSRWVIACLSVAYAGAAWVPLDPDTPARRVAALLRQADVAAVVTDERLGKRLPDRAPAVVNLDTDAAGIAARSRALPACPLSPRDAAYCIFTSGSSGTPRVVVVEHGAVTNFVRSIQELFGVTPDDRFLQYASPGFDVSVFEIFVPLLSGASLAVAGDEERLSVEALSRILVRQRITVAELPPALMDMMDPERFPDLRVASVGGEPFAGSLVTRWSRYCRVVNGYGPTEATIGLIYKECGGEMRSPPPIGRPVDNHRVYVLDSRMRPVPYGAVGELYLAGAGLARGYLRDPALTADRFTPDPFSSSGQRLLRTGDVVRFDAGGDLVFLGRSDRQVKVRGQRMELGELESLLAALPGIRSAVADVLSGPERQLVCYVVAEPGCALDPGKTRENLMARLPAYMVPARLIEVTEIPVNSSGKVDLRALAAMAATLPAPAAARAGELAGLRREVYEQCVVRALPEAPREPDADLFAAGMTSLQLMRLLGLVRKTFRADVPGTAFMRQPTIATLAGLIEQALATAPEGQRLAPLPRAPLDAELPLSPGQHSLWFMNDLITNRAAYHVVEAHRLRGPLDAGDLRRALRELVGRHEALRTRIRVRDGVPYQVVEPRPSLAWEDADLTGAQDPAGAATELASMRSAEPFDLSTGPLLRVTLITLGPADHVFALTMHHIVSDGRSTEVLFTELSQLYGAFRDGRPAALSPLPARYADFAWWQRELLTGDGAARELARWRGQLAGAPADADLPFDRPRPAVHGHRGATLRFELPGETAAAVRQLGRSRGATLFMVLLAGFTALLARYSRARDVVIGTPTANRSREELHDLIGFLSNMVVLRIGCSDDPAFGTLVTRVKNTLLRATQDGGVAFERLVSEVAPDRDLSRHPLFQVTFQAYDAPGSFLRLPGIAAEPLRLDDRTCRFDLSLAIKAGADGHLHGALNYNVELLDEGTAGRIIGHYGRLLACALADPARPLSRLALLGDGERQAIMAQSASPAPAPVQTISEMFERQLAAGPERVAVSSGAGGMTYRELGAAAGRIARLLRSRGIGPEDLAAVCLERGPMLVTAILGIAAAGAAYLPVDPGHPAERVRSLLADSGARIMLTQRSLAARLPSAGELVVLDDPAGQAAREPAAAPAAAPRPGSLAYVMYTSGSTGQPKGVAVPQHAVVRLALGMPGLEITPADTFLLMAPAAFDASTFELWTPLAHGARLAIYPPGRRARVSSARC